MSHGTGIILIIHYMSGHPGTLSEAALTSQSKGELAPRQFVGGLNIHTISTRLLIGNDGYPSLTYLTGENYKLELFVNWFFIDAQ